MRVALFVTCLVDAFDPETGVAAVRVLRASGCEVVCPLGQTCCGQPAWNAGFPDEAAAVARTSLAVLDSADAEAIVVPAGSCATMIKVFWPELFEIVGDHSAAARARRVGGRTAEFSAFVAARDLPPLASPPLRVAYHHSCHMLRELGVDAAPTRLIDSVAGVERVDWPADRICCGFGGLFSLKLPETSVAMADDKLDALAETRTDVLCGSDGSCLMHMRTRASHEGRPLTTRHIAQLLADALPHGAGGGQP